MILEVLAPEKMNITKEMLSPYSESIREKFNISISQVNKLVTTLKSKETYVLHYRNLHLYLDLGLKLMKVHRVPEFDQSPWLKQYIDFNTEKRKNAKKSIRKRLLQTHGQQRFRQLMENLQRQVDVRLVTDEKKFYVL